MKKLSMSLLAIFVLSIIISCGVMIPETDVTPPNFSFRIFGDGFDRSFTQEDDFTGMRLNLKENTEYRFIYTGADQGGVKLIQWQLGASDEINFSQPVFPYESWTIRDISSLNRMIEWMGDRTDPKTASFFSGKFRTGDLQNYFTRFRFFVRDFGGQSGTENSVRGDLMISIGNGDDDTNFSRF